MAFVGLIVATSGTSLFGFVTFRRGKVIIATNISNATITGFGVIRLTIQTFVFSTGAITFRWIGTGGIARNAG